MGADFYAYLEERIGEKWVSRGELSILCRRGWFPLFLEKRFSHPRYIQNKAEAWLITDPAKAGTHELVSPEFYADYTRYEEDITQCHFAALIPVPELLAEDFFSWACSVPLESMSDDIGVYREIATAVLGLFQAASKDCPAFNTVPLKNLRLALWYGG